MITDKEKIDRYMDRVESFIPNDILNALSDEIFDGTAFQPDEIKACADWIWLRASEQARKEAADRALAFIKTLNSESMDLWGEYEDNGLRAAILCDSVIKESLITDRIGDDNKMVDHIPDIGKKLAIAVKALEEIRDGDLQHNRIARDALKEIQ